jgi:hypothetical protein
MTLERKTRRLAGQTQHLKDKHDTGRTNTKWVRQTRYWQDKQDTGRTHTTDRTSTTLAGETVGRAMSPYNLYPHVIIRNEAFFKPNIAVEFYVFPLPVMGDITMATPTEI